MIKIFLNLMLLTFVLNVVTTSAQKVEKIPEKEILTIQGDTNINQPPPPPPPPPAPLIYKAPEAGDLKDFISEDKTFQATFPGIPKITKIESENGFVISYRVYRYGSNSIVNTFDYNSDLEKSKEKIFENIKNSFIKSPKTTIEAERDFQFEGKTGKEFDVRQDFNFLKVRLLIVGTRIYETISDATNWHIISDATKKQFFVETERFFNSFKHLKLPDKAVAIAPEGFLGEVKNRTYKNAFFNFSFEFPQDWYQLDNVQINRAKNVGLEALKTDKDKTNQAFADATQREVVIFMAANGIYGSGNNSSFGVGVLKQPNGKVSAEVVIKAVRDFFLTNPKIKLVEDVRTVELNETPFSSISIETSTDTATVNQKIYTTMRNGYSVTFAASYKNSDELKELEKILGTIKFNLPESRQK